jgi:predicted metal-dependent hydrolase
MALRNVVSRSRRPRNPTGAVAAVRLTGQDRGVSEIRLDGRTVRYTLVRRARSRHIRITVRPDGVRASAPPGCTRREVEAFLRRRAGWVLHHLDRLAAAAPPPLADGAMLPLLGGAVELGVRHGRRARWRFRDEDARLAVEAPDPSDVDAVVESWYRTLAAGWFRRLADERAAALGVRYARLSVRDGRTRWASCSSAGTLSFSWRLMMAPARVGEYVVVHEVAHLVEMNHSPAFWALVKAAWPGWRADRDWLRRHAPALELGPAATLAPPPAPTA